MGVVEVALEDRGDERRLGGAGGPCEQLSWPAMAFRKRPWRRASLDRTVDISYGILR